MNMELFNIYGLIFLAIIMIPNVIFAIKCKDGFENKWNNKSVFAPSHIMISYNMRKNIM